jgi:hypothetical protein
MVNEVSERGNGNEGNPQQWTIRLGKYVVYNPTPFRDQSDLIQKTIISLLLIGLGVYLVTVDNNIVNYFGWLIIGSIAFLYFLSLFETYLLDKKEKEKLK